MALSTVKSSQSPSGGNAAAWFGTCAGAVAVACAGGRTTGPPEIPGPMAAGAVAVAVAVAVAAAEYNELFSKMKEFKNWSEDLAPTKTWGIVVVDPSGE